MMRRPLRLYFLYFEIPMAVVFWNQCCTRVGEVMWLSQPNTKGVKAITDYVHRNVDSCVQVYNWLPKTEVSIIGMQTPLPLST